MNLNTIFIAVILIMGSYIGFLEFRNNSLKKDNILKSIEVSNLKEGIEFQNSQIDKMKVDYEKSIEKYKSHISDINIKKEESFKNINSVLTNINTNDKCVENDLLIKSLKTLQK